MADRSVYWKGKQVLVTGANGFVGSWLTDYLVSYGANVIVLEKEVLKDSIFEQKNLRTKCKIISGVLEDFELMQQIMREHEIEIIFHLAAQTQVTDAYKDPFTTMESNVRGTYNLLEAIRRHKPNARVIVASSDKAYGSHEKLPYTEDFALQGRGPYDVSKSCIDLIAQSYHQTYGLHITISRCGNFFGPGDLNFDRIVPGAIAAILKGEQFLIRSDGTFTRDYIYVKDAADSYLTLAEKMDELKDENKDKKNIDGEAFNFTNETQLNVLQFYEMIAKLMKSDLKPKILNIAKAEIKHQHLSAEKAKQVLGWSAKYSIEEGLRETIPWYKEMLTKR